MGAAFGTDGRYVWYAQRRGSWIYNTPLSDYTLAVYDRETGQTATRASAGQRVPSDAVARRPLAGVRHAARGHDAPAHPRPRERRRAVAR